MKRFLILITILISYLITHAEVSYTFSTELSNGRDHHYTANSHIMLKPGFKAQPIDGHEVMLNIDPYGVFPPEWGLTGGPFPLDDGVVGAIDGNISAGMLGAATYTLPLQLPEGLGGIHPQLSICYNSQAKNGLLGWAWDLGGISSITRTGKNNYYDGSIGPINYNDDRFLLDGQHLLKIGGGNYGGNGVKYRTEEDQMSCITSYTDPSVNGTAYFVVKTSDGHTLYYGSSEDSRALKDDANHVTVWLLKKVEDRYGNTMNYTYFQTSDSYKINRITYSGNSNDQIIPAYAIEFKYKSREDNELVYVGNVLYNKKYLLTDISIQNDDEEIYAYHFNYNEPTPNGGYYYYLLQDITFSAGKQHFNPTRIQWGSNNYPVNGSSNVKMGVATTGDYSNFGDAVKFNGDFNGDGFTDVIAARTNSTGIYNNAQLYINKGASDKLRFEYIRSFTLDENANWIHVADFDGNGRDDLLFTYRVRQPAPLPDRIRAEVFLSNINSLGDLVFTRYQTSFYNIPSNMEEGLLIGDFLGTGKDVFIIQSVSENNGTAEGSRLFAYDSQVDDFLMTYFAEQLETNRFFPADYNGDGLMEILYKKQDGRTCITKLSQANGSLHYVEMSQSFVYLWDDCFPGDYNGDGMTDVLLYIPGSIHPWQIVLATANGLSANSYPLSDDFPYTSPGDYHYSLDRPHHTSQYIKVGDFDGNGCSDLALYHNNKFHVYYGPIRTTGDHVPFTNHQQINSTIFGLYDNMGMGLGNFLGRENSSFLGGNTLSFLSPLTWRHEVQTLIDGLGRVTSLQYDYLMPNPNEPTENDFYRNYSTNHDFTRNLYCTYVPVRALKQISTTNVSERPVTHRCYYQGAIIHRQGKGFLGFSKTRQEDYINNQLQLTTLREYRCEPWCEAILMAMTQESVYDLNQQLMAQSTINNVVYSHLSNNKVYILLADKTKEEYDPHQPNRLLKKEIQQNTVDTHCAQTYEYNGRLSVTSTTVGVTDQTQHTLPSQCEFQKTTFTTYKLDDLTNWIINKPATTTVIYHREGGYEDVSNHRIFSYNGSKPFQISSITDIPNDGSHPEDPLAIRTDYEYDPVGNIKTQTIVTPNDNLPTRRESYEYSKDYGRRRLTKQTNALGQTTTYAYDPLYEFCTQVTDANGLVTQHERTPLGNTISIHYPDGTTACTALRWDGKKYLKWEKKTGQQTKITLHAPTGEVLTTTGFDINGNSVSANIEYDNYGREQKKFLPHKEGESVPSISYTYNSHHQVEQIIHTDGSYETLDYDGERKSTTYVALDGSTQTESKIFNAMGWLVKSTDAHGTSVIFDYYPDGKPKWSQIEGKPETRIEMQYDGLRNRISLNDPNYGTTTYQYNAFKELVQQTTPKQDRTQFTYDKLGNLATRIETDHQTGENVTTTWTYHTQAGRKGLLKRISSPNQTIDYEYDDLLRMTKIIDRCLGTDYVTIHTYDEASRPLETTYPSGYAIRYCYSFEGFMRSISDTQSNVLWRADETNTLGQPLRCTFGNGVVTHYEYDKNTQRVLGIHSESDRGIIQDYRYNYDEYGNMILRDDLKNSFEERFTYDELNRLTSVNDPNGTSEFHYDPLGRMTDKTKQNKAVFSNADYAGQRPYAIKSAQSRDGIFPEERMDLTFTTFDKVASITEGNTLVSFVYGFDHQRIMMTENVNGTLREKRYVGNCEFIHSQGNNPIARTFLSNPSGVFAVAETVEGETTIHYIHKDHLGSWTVITDSRGAIEQENRFDAWGHLEDGGELMFDHGYTGHEHIQSVGLVNMNGRLYDPTTSSMLSPDNHLQLPDCTQNFNRYAYCLNNPLSYTDPDGNSFIETALYFYLMYCTTFGYEIQKWTDFFAFHIDLHISSQQIGIGFDLSAGLPKSWGVSWRIHCGVTYYWRFFDNSRTGWEVRAGSEWYFLSSFGYSGTTFLSKEMKQTTNSIVVGDKLFQITYENDYMFNIANELIGIVPADNGDRYRTAAAKIRFGPIYIGVNIFTGDPGFKDANRVSKPDDNGRETYVINEAGDDPDKYRAGLLYIGVGPFRFGTNSEKVRHFLQNRFAHDFICGGKTPYFKVLDRPDQCYFYFGTETGGTLW